MHLLCGHGGQGPSSGHPWIQAIPGQSSSVWQEMGVVLSGVGEGVGIGVKVGVGVDVGVGEIFFSHHHPTGEGDDENGENS